MRSNLDRATATRLVRAAGIVRRGRRRAFSLIEMLIAIAISGSVMAATLVAFDAMFKVYETATNSASNHVIARITVNRLLGMIRTGSEFGPFPQDVLDGSVNPLHADYFEFASSTDDETGEVLEVTRVEFRYVGQPALLRTWGSDVDPPGAPDGVDATGELWLVIIADDGAEQEFLMLSDVRTAHFSLEYDIGPRLVQGTVDITFEPSLAREGTEEVWTPATPETVRLVASAMPRRSIR